MGNNNKNQVKWYKRKGWRNTIISLAAVIVFATTYALILPASTITEDVAQEDPAIFLEQTAPVEEAAPVEEPAPVVEEPAPVVEEPAAPAEGEAEPAAPAEGEAEAAAPAEGEAEPVAPAEGEAEAAAPAEGEAEPAAPAEGEAEEVDPMPARLFEMQIGDLIVKVEAPQGAFPTGAKMRLEWVEDQDTLNAIENAVEGDVVVKTVKAIDITFFDAAGKEIEPLKPIHVSIRDAMVEQAENVEVVHVDDAGEATVVEQKDEETLSDEVTFERDQFSVYAIVETETITARVLTASGNAYDVTVTYGPEAQIPAGSTLRVTEFPVGSAEYEEALKAVVAEKQANGEFVDLESLGFAALDISIIDPNGQEIEPAAPVQVDMRINYLPDGANLAAAASSMEIQHHVETGNGGVVIETVAEGVTTTSFNQATDTQVVSSGTAVNPNNADMSVPVVEQINLADFADQVRALLANREEETEVASVEASFSVDVFSTYSITWDEGGGGGGSASTTLRFRNGNNTSTRAYVTVYYVDLDTNTYISRPSSIGNNVDRTLSNNSTVNVDIANVLGTSISGYSYQGAIYFSNDNQAHVIDTIRGVRANNTNTVSFLNDNQTVHSTTNSNAGSIYLYYQESSAPSGVTVHYGYMNGSTFVEFPDGKPEYEPSFNNGNNFLIYDVEGYQYSATYRNTISNNNTIPPILNINNNGVPRYYNNGNWSNLSVGDNIYVVYEAAPEPTTGGTPEPSTEEEWPDEEDPARKPVFGKSSIANTDGVTNTITLSITGPDKPVQSSTPADVIVVFDVSGSMGYDMNGRTRLYRAQTAVNTMANTLLNGQDTDVRMALISFSTDAEVVQGFTDNYTTFSGKVNGLSADGGTNWEKALMLANQMAVDSDRATFVVFVTDGDPTFRVSRGEVSNANLDMNTSSTYQYYRNNQVFGTGNSDNQGRNFDFAVAQVSAIAGANKTFYAIGISNDVTKVQNLTTEGGVAADHAFIASDSTAMENAFKSITESIKTILGFGNVSITDGITELSNLEMKVMETVDPDSFTYYRYGGEGNKYGADYAHRTEWTTLEADGCNPASYDETTGAVQWNMGNFQLEGGVTYIVQFRVWPSQEAYDLVASLNNHIVDFDDLTPEEQAQIVENEDGSYALRTNTDNVHATYQQSSQTGTTVTIEEDAEIKDAEYVAGQMENMPLVSMQLTIKKEFEDDLTAAEDRETEVTLVLRRRNANQTPAAAFVDYPVPQQGGTTSANIVLNEGNNWTYTLYVAPGLIVDGEVLEHGYDFTIAEPGIDYHYGLVEEIINPMVVDGEDTYYGDGQLITGETIAEYTDRALTAVNRVKSGIDIKKVLLDADGNEIFPDIEFTITGQLLGPDGNPFVWQDGDDVNASGAYHKYDRDGNRIVYKGHFADSSNITFTLKPGEYIRFINVPEGCTFVFTETLTMPEPYEWKSTAAVTQHRTEPNGPWTTEGDVQPTVSGNTASLTTGVVGNKQYAITFTNGPMEIELPDVLLVKTDLGGTRIGDATFTFDQRVNGAWSSMLPEGTSLTVTAEGDPVTLSGLYPGVLYRLTETSAPEGYIIRQNESYFTVEMVDGSYVVKLTDSAGNVLDNQDNEFAKAEANTISVKNVGGAALPRTGGNGTLAYTLGGLFLLTIGMVYAAGLKRKGRHEA